MKYLRYILLIILPLAVILLIFLLPRFVRINKISCKSQYGQCGKPVGEKLSEFEGRTLLVAKKGIKETLKNDKTVSDFMVQFKLPGNFIVNIIEKKAKFALKSTETYAFVDKEGQVLGMESSSPLPFLEINTLPPNVGEKVSQENLFGLNLIYSLYSSYQVGGGKIENQSLVIQLPQGITVIFPLEGDEAVLLGSLRVILDRLNEDIKDSRIEKEVKVIDLRFQNPVLK